MDSLFKKVLAKDSLFKVFSIILSEKLRGSMNGTVSGKKFCENYNPAILQPAFFAI
ncbi:MAG: hypothetical protein IPL53_09390 [Ignavibacteria bacterium]|nr:hypothetical protein [Ignavibacteria bacterium]